MSALVYVGYDQVITQADDGRAWHRLDQPFNGHIGWQEAYMKVAPWSAKKVQLTLPTGQLSETYSVVRQDPTDPEKLVELSDSGGVTDDYVIFDNEKLFALAAPFLESEQCYITSAGTLRKGGDVFLCLRVKQEYVLNASAGDVIRPFILFRNSHGNKKAFRATISGVRTVCANTVALAEQSMGLSVCHKGNLEANIKSVVDTIDVVNQRFAVTAEQYSYLKTISINQEELEKYVVKVLSTSRIEEDLQDKIDTEDLTGAQIEEKRKELESALFPRLKETIQENFVTSPGCDGQSMLSALSAVTYWTTHQRGQSDETRFRSLHFVGDSNRVNIKAMRIALEMAAAK